MILTILIIVLLLCLIGGGLGSLTMGALSWSPLAILIVIVTILYFTGHLHH